MYVILKIMVTGRGFPGCRAGISVFTTVDTVRSSKPKAPGTIPKKSVFVFVLRIGLVFTVNSYSLQLANFTFGVQCLAELLALV